MTPEATTFRTSQAPPTSPASTASPASRIADLAPRDTRSHVCRVLRPLHGKRAAMSERRHGNIPL
ncbi:hypothetical protein EEJ42_41005 [Streptomyces botrytidirepellens]|uniref:Uncharacterized protein n=1 Tax=Streptomyces botrytidirepellens TaxID=2486417 RepID=A0A3M8TD56_9ACTN|nr:hypothetical protein EEJ42_41005 [Streptomyces botrytidirepellens]